MNILDQIASEKPGEAFKVSLSGLDADGSFFQSIALVHHINGSLSLPYTQTEIN